MRHRRKYRKPRHVGDGKAYCERCKKRTRWTVEYGSEQGDAHPTAWPVCAVCKAKDLLRWAKEA